MRRLNAVRNQEFCHGADLTDWGLCDYAALARHVAQLQLTGEDAEGKRMLTIAAEQWLDEQIWPQIQSLMLNDAYFRLVKYVFEISQKYIDPIGNLVVNGYVTFQMIGIRRLCDNKRDVISLRRLVIDSTLPNKQALLKKLDACDEVCDRASDHIAHTGNPVRRLKITDWNLRDDDLTNAHKAICEVAITLDRTRANPKGYVKIIPVVQTLDMREFNLSEADTKKLWEFWHAHNGAVNAWI
jgi:hypothetical protein